MAATRPLVRLGKDVYLVKAPQHEAAAVKKVDPECIVLFGWMDAQMKHLQKYLNSYHTLFPQTDILLLRSHQTSFYRPSSYIRKASSPAAEHLRSTYPSARPGKDSPILVHVFSNGGCLGLRALNEMMKKAEIGSEEAKRPLLAAEGRSGIPARAFIFDSCPGLSTLQATILAFTAPLRSRFTRWPATALVTLVYAIGKLYSLISRRPPYLLQLARDLNAQLPPSPRLYLYSESDKLIPHADVLSHAATAREKGIDVEFQRFEGTSHVAHTRGAGNEKRYWEKVQEVWEKSGR